MSAPPGEVTERLERLAGHAPTGLVDPDALWSRGRRRQRRRWAAVAASAAAVAVVGAVSTPPLARLADPPIASVAESGPVLPDVIRPPSGWAPAFDAAPGPLSAVGLSSRSGWIRSHQALWGVSALTGESRWLDLPDALASADGAALSEDGRKLAYWTSLGSAGEPTVDGEPRVATGVAIRDLVSGEVRRWDAGTTFGVGTSGLAWAGDVLWFSGGAYREAEHSSWSPSTWTWTPTGDPTVATEDPWAQGMAEAHPAADGFLVAGGSAVRRVRVVSADGDITAVRLVRDGTTSSPSVSPDGRYAVGIEQRPPSTFLGTSLPVLVGEVESGRAVMERMDGGVQASAVLGWRSPVVAILAAPSDDDGDEVVDRLQVATADVTHLDYTHLLDIAGSVPPAFAADAWTAEVVPAPDAPFAPDPRLVGAGTIVLLAFGISLWRDVRRRRGRA